MTLKTKAFGFAAAAALTLSAATGAMAADPIPNTSVNLLANAQGDCNVSATAGSIDLGDWMWDGDSYELQTGSAGGAIMFTIKQTVQASPDWNCHVTVGVSNLTLGGGTIDAANVSFSSGSTTGSSYVVSTPKGPGATLEVNATLNDVPNVDIPAGEYSGTVSATASKSSN